MLSVSITRPYWVFPEHPLRKTWIKESVQLVRNLRWHADGGKGITQQLLARRMDVDQSWISHLETRGDGKQGPSYVTLKSVAHACGIPWPAPTDGLPSRQAWMEEAIQLLRDMRASAGLSQERLANRLGIDQEAISAMEEMGQRVADVITNKGGPSYVTCKRIAHACGVSWPPPLQVVRF